MSEDERQLLTYMLAAPANEIREMSPSTVGECAKFLGLPENEPYNHRVHYVIIAAKMRGEWARKMISEAMGYNL